MWDLSALLESSLINLIRNWTIRLISIVQKCFVELGCLCNMCIYFYLINQLIQLYISEMLVFITFYNFECIITA